jgi:hypothetical protein
MRKAAPSSSMLALYEGQRCIGHLIVRGKSGFEAYDIEDRSLGVYPSQRGGHAGGAQADPRRPR